MSDPTEDIRRKMLQEQREKGPLTREELEELYGDVWDTRQLGDLFEVEGFSAPFCVVRRKSDGRRGSLEFQHMPRFYYSFVPTT